MPLNDSEQRRWHEIESMLVEDLPQEEQIAEARRQPDRRRRLLAVAVAVAGLALTVAGLWVPSVPLAVLGICTIGAGAGIFTWQPRR